MNRKKAGTAGKEAPLLDEAFDPWEQVRPIPLFLIAVVFALALWGLLTYLSEHRAQDAAAEKRADNTLAAKASTGASPAHVQRALQSAAVDAANNLNNADAGTLELVMKGRGQAWSCASCHGEAGQGNLSTPRLAGQPAAYLRKQLQDFASGQRMNESMAVIAKALSESEMESLGHYYAQVELGLPVVPTLGGDLERGRQLAQKGDWKTDVPACFSCHGLSGEGVAPGFPALAGQQPDYLFAQLAAWHAGERGNSPQGLMDGISRRMTPQDMRSVADYLGSLPKGAGKDAAQSDAAGRSKKDLPISRPSAG